MSSNEFTQKLQHSLSTSVSSGDMYALATAIGNAVEEHLATKADLKSLQDGLGSEYRTGFERIEQLLHQRFKNLEDQIHAVATASAKTEERLLSTMSANTARLDTKLAELQGRVDGVIGLVGTEVEQSFNRAKGSLAGDVADKLKGTVWVAAGLVIAVVGIGIGILYNVVAS